MEGTVGTREGLLRYGTGWRTRLVHGSGFCGTERDEGHGWYTGVASAVRNGIRDTVGTREGLLRYGTGWRARLVHGGASEARNGVRGTVGTREGLLRYGKG